MRRSTLSPLRSLIALLVAGLALTGAPPAAAEDAASALQHHLDAARKARTANDWETASTQFEMALRQTELLADGDVRIIRALEESARAFQHQKNGPRAIQLQERAVELQRAASASPGNALAESLYRLGRLYREFNDKESAEATYREALEIRETLEPHSVRMSMMRRDLSKAIQTLRPEDDEAEALLIEDLDLGDTASRRERLGRYYAETDAHKSSVTNFEEAVAIERELPLPSARRLVNLLTSLATEYKKLGRFDESETAFLDAIELREDDMGATHPYLAFTVRKLAGLYIEQERWLDAESALLRARELNEAAWGETDHECSCTTGDMLAQVRAALGRVETPARSEAAAFDAVRLIETAAPAETAEAEEISEADKQIREHDADARRLRKVGDIEAAKDAASQALTLREETYGADSLEAATGLERLARLWKDQRRNDEAVELFVRRLAILETQLDADDPKIAATLRTLGQLERDRDRGDEAERYLLSEVNLREASGQRIEAARALETLGSLNLKRQLPERAEANFARAVELWEDFAGTKAPEIVRNRARMAEAYLELDRLDEAEATLNALLAGEESKRHPDTSLLIQVLSPLKTVLDRTDRTEEAAAVEARLQELRTLRQAALNGPRPAKPVASKPVAQIVERVAN